MRIFVAGATGAIGRPLIAHLLGLGHDVVALTRSPEKAQTLAEQGVEPVIADVFDADAVKAAITHAHPDVVIEQLTALPKTYTGKSMSAAAALNTRIRLEGGANVLAAAQAAGVRRYLRQSIAFWAVPGDGLADEETPLAFDASPAVAADAHTVTELERRLLETPNIEGIVLRYGFFHGTGTWFAPDGDVAHQLFVQEGAKVTITGQHQERLAHASKTLGEEVLAIRADTRSLNDLETVFTQIKERWGRLNILFVNAGITKFSPLLDVDEAFINETMDINFKGALFTVQKAVPLMTENSSIVFNTSINNQMGMPGSGIYAASKAALRSLVRVLAAELIGRGIRVNAVSPGPIKTPLYKKLGFSQEQLDQVATNLQQTIPMHRFGEPEEIAKAVLFLASDQASFVLGEELVWTVAGPD